MFYGFKKAREQVSSRKYHRVRAKRIFYSLFRVLTSIPAISGRFQNQPVSSEKHKIELTRISLKGEEDKRKFNEGRANP